MEKSIYLLRGFEEESYQTFSDRVLSLSKEIASTPMISALKITYTNVPPPGISIIPFQKKKIAAISIYQAKTSLFDHLISAKGYAGSYQAEEAIPRAYDKSWPDLTETPGVCLLTLFKKKKGLDYKLFLDRWHNSHTPLSLKIHPLWNYNRNVTTARLTADSPDWDGIVEEQVKTRADLLNPIKFFGSPLIMPYRMWQVYSDTRSFLDYPTIEPYFASEIHIKSQ